MSQDIVLTRRGQMAVIAAIVATIGLLASALMYVWGASNRSLERASKEYTACMAVASSPEAEALCEQEWKKAQDAYFIP